MEAKEPSSISEFYDLLDRHDWFYEFSDDGQCWRSGSANLAKLTGYARGKPEWSSLMKAFKEHHFSGEAWGTTKAPKPERPAA